MLVLKISSVFASGCTPQLAFQLICLQKVLGLTEVIAHIRVETATPLQRCSKSVGRIKEICQSVLTYFLKLTNRLA